MQSEAADGRQVVELEVFAPEHGVCARFAGGSRVQHVVQTQLAVIALLRRKISGLDDPQLQHVIHTPAVILQPHRDITDKSGAGLLSLTNTVKISLLTTIKVISNKYF